MTLPHEVALLGVGLLATIVVTVYVARLSRKAICEQTKIEKHLSGREQPSGPTQHTTPGGTGWPWGIRLAASPTVLAVVAVALLTSTARCNRAAHAHQRLFGLKNLFGQPSATLQEADQREQSGPSVDHSVFDALLRKHVDKDGWVDYEGFRSDAVLLDAYIASIGHAPFATLGRDAKLALLINAYNAFTLRLILDHYPIKSIKDIPFAKRWDAKRWRLGSMILSLNQIEHEQIRPKFAEPRIHFALVCAAIGCPKLRNEAYRADRIDEQLEDQTRYVHTHDRWFRYRSGASEVHLTRLYDWYGADFKRVAGSVLDFAARYSSPLRAAIDGDEELRPKWLNYDWTLNDRKNNR